MKTTNKILIGALIFSLAVFTYFILKITSYMEINEIKPSGIIKTETIAIESFDSLSVQKGVLVNLSYGEQESLTVTSDTTFRKYLNVNVDNSQLKIHMDKKMPDSTKVIVNLTANELQAIKVSNQAKLSSDQRLIGEALKIEAHNGAVVDLNVELNNLECDLSGGAKAILSGKTNSLKALSQNRAKLHAENLQVVDAKVKASNFGYIHFSVSGTVDVKAMHAGVVEYSGDPQVTNMEVTEGGKLVKVN